MLQAWQHNSLQLKPNCIISYHIALAPQSNHFILLLCTTTIWSASMTGKFRRFFKILSCYCVSCRTSKWASWRCCSSSLWQGGECQRHSKFTPMFAVARSSRRGCICGCTQQKWGHQRSGIWEISTLQVDCDSRWWTSIPSNFSHPINQQFVFCPSAWNLVRPVTVDLQNSSIEKELCWILSWCMKIH